MCEQHFAETTVRNSDGAFVVKMPFKEDPSSLGHSYVNARNRFLSLERRFKHDPSFHSKYNDFLREYERLGHMTLDTGCTPSPENSKTKYFIPHHGVIRDSSTTTKLRVVFDASAPTSTGVSLNDIQMVGPVVQDDLFSILTRFRQHKYVVSGDVEKMYRGIQLSPDQRSLQKIVFRFDPSEPLRSYTLNTVTYGTASAPYLATKCLVSLADNIEDNRVKSAIQRDFYVDDYLSGGSTISDTVDVTKAVRSVLSSAKFNLRKWRSNNVEILKQINPEVVNNNNNNTLQFSEHGLNPAPSKTLGLNWVCDSDSLTYTINITSANKVTKRHILSVISQIFDPLGLVGPCVVEAKILMQRLWLNKYDWDDAVSFEVTDANITSLDRWKRIQYIRQHFWGRFHNEYTSLLQAKSKWLNSRGEVTPGSLVLIKDKTTPPLLWSLGRVTKTYPGVDGVTRVAELKTRRGTIRRAFNCICPLPIEDF
nr:uncharacterized protein LOC126055825 isoform X8 [Helicoverpa armigera]